MESKILNLGEELGPPEKRYMKRWVLNLGVFSVRLHKWICSDDHRALHDHPYCFVVLVLKGEYEDVTPNGVEVLKTGSIRFRHAKHVHTVRVTKSPTWTLLLCGPWVRNWGFYKDGKFVRREKYFKMFGKHHCDASRLGEKIEY